MSADGSQKRRTACDAVNGGRPPLANIRYVARARVIVGRTSKGLGGSRSEKVDAALRLARHRRASDGFAKRGLSSTDRAHAIAGRFE